MMTAESVVRVDMVGNDAASVLLFAVLFIFFWMWSSLPRSLEHAASQV